MTRVAPFAVPALLAGVLFGAQPAGAQSASDLLVRIDQLENQVRQLTGSVEQLQYRNQQLETLVKRTQEDNEFRFQELGGKGGARPAPPQRQGMGQPAPQPPVPPAAPPSYTPQPSYGANPQPSYAPPPAGRRGDVFDPNQSPAAPGAPRPLGSLYSDAAELPPGESAPGGRQSGAPLDLSTMSAAAAGEASLAPRGGMDGLPPPPPRNPNATGAQYATLPPSQSPRDEYDLAYGYLLRKDYAQAEETFRIFLKKYPGNQLEADAQYGLGESLFLRQNYRDAAETFLALSKKFERSPKAPEALLRLGQSLAGMQQKELACATFGEVGRKYPRAGPTVRQAVDREQKRVHC